MGATGLNAIPAHDLMEGALDKIDFSAPKKFKNLQEKQAYEKMVDQNPGKYVYVKDTYSDQDHNYSNYYDKEFIKKVAKFADKSGVPRHLFAGLIMDESQFGERTHDNPGHIHPEKHPEIMKTKDDLNQNIYIRNVLLQHSNKKNIPVEKLKTMIGKPGNEDLDWDIYNAKVDYMLYASAEKLRKHLDEAKRKGQSVLQGLQNYSGTGKATDEYNVAFGKSMKHTNFRKDMPQGKRKLAFSEILKNNPELKDIFNEGVVSSSQGGK